MGNARLPEALARTLLAKNPTRLQDMMRARRYHLPAPMAPHPKDILLPRAVWAAQGKKEDGIL